MNQTNKFLCGERVEWIALDNSTGTGVIIEHSCSEETTNEYLIKNDNGGYIVVDEENIRRIGELK